MTGQQVVQFVACRSSVRGNERSGIRGSNPQGYPCRGRGGKSQGAAQPLPEGSERKEQINPKRGRRHTRKEKTLPSIALQEYPYSMLLNCGFVRNRAGRSLAPRRPAKIVFRPSFRALRRLQPENTNAFTVAGGEWGSHKSFHVPSGIGLQKQPVGQAILAALPLRKMAWTEKGATRNHHTGRNMTRQNGPG